MFQAQGNTEERKAMGKVCGAVERINIPSIGVIQTGTGSFFAINSMSRKALAKPTYDKFLRCPVGLGYQVYVTLVFSGNATVEIATEHFAGLQRNGGCSGGKTEIELRGEVLQRAPLVSPSVPRTLPVSRRPRSLMVRIWCL